MLGWLWTVRVSGARDDISLRSGTLKQTEGLRCNGWKARKQRSLCLTRYDTNSGDESFDFISISICYVLACIHILEEKDNFSHTICSLCYLNVISDRSTCLSLVDSDKCIHWSVCVFMSNICKALWAKSASNLSLHHASLCSHPFRSLVIENVNLTYLHIRTTTFFKLWW